MMGRLGITITLAIVATLFSGDLWAFQKRTVRYPRVYGATGRPYGPTQAHYQYQKQYGRPWHGHGGLTATVNSNAGLGYVNGYPAGHLSYGHSAYFHSGGCYSGYGGVISPLGYSLYPSFTPPVPRVIYGYPPVIPNNPLPNPAKLQNPQQPGVPLGESNPPPPASTPEARLKSLRAQAQGDQWFRQQEYHKAFDRYKRAVSEARDRGAAHLRLAICYAALGHLDLAARQLKRGVAADPQMAASADDLSTIYGADNSIAQSAMVHRATLWAKEDIRDPDRLFLLGVLLYLKGDKNAEHAPLLLETGMQLRGGGDYFRSFLAAAKTSSEKTKAAADAGINDPPQPNDLPQNPTDPPGSDVVPPLPAPPAPGDGETAREPSSPGPSVPAPSG